MREHFDRLIISFVLLVFLALLAVFHKDNFETAFLEHSADLVLGCLLGLVTNKFSGSKGGPTNT